MPTRHGDGPRNKPGEIALKTNITEPYIELEAKYANARAAKNVVHLMMASNEDWVVPAGLDECRSFVLEVTANRVRNLTDDQAAALLEAPLQEFLRNQIEAEASESARSRLQVGPKFRITTPRDRRWYSFVSSSS